MKKSHAKSLLNRAKQLADCGYSVIPVQGDYSANEPKRAAIKWRQYQRRIAGDKELDAAFAADVTALGIVCGRVSQLLVIDFDEHFRYRRFCRHLPQFSRTYTVKTRRGFHLYFRVSERVPSHQFDGGDIKGDRSYVIAPPSVIGGFEYESVCDFEVMKLEKADVDRLLEYFHVREMVHVVAGKPIRSIADLDVAQLYTRLAGRLGRNNALYRAASVARQQGMSRSDAEKGLLIGHVDEAGDPRHKYETRRERLVEGKRTIESAYRGAVKEFEMRVTLPNSVRERLLKLQGSTVMARFLDAMYLVKWEADSFFTLNEAIKMGKRYGLNRKSVLDVLTGDRAIFDGKHIISRRYVDYLVNGGLKCRKRGRPVELMFQVPSAARLLSVLKVSWTPSDPVREEDVRSAHRYRLAVHREYIGRVAPQVSMKQLGVRLGVSERTVRRYNRELGVAVTAHIGRLRLAQENVGCLPVRRRGVRKKSTDGYWLETMTGVRLPAWRHIGVGLLKRKERGVQLCMRRASAYSLSGGLVPSVEYHKLDVSEFVRVRAWRGEGVEGLGMVERVKGMLRSARRRASVLRYQKVQLDYDTVAVRIAEDKVAESINGYLYAYDSGGAEVRRPARRGVAYGMLKEFGNGNVFLALRDGYGELVVSMARHALRAGKVRQSVDLLAQAFS